MQRTKNENDDENGIPHLTAVSAVQNIHCNQLQQNLTQWDMKRQLPQNKFWSWKKKESQNLEQLVYDSGR